MKSLIFTLCFFIGASSFAASAEQVRYNDLFKRQELIHRSYRDIYTRLSRIENQESLKSWYRLFAKNPVNNNAYKQVTLNLSQGVLGRDFRDLIFYYATTGQIEQASKTLGLYLTSSYVILDNFIYNPQSQIWNASLVDEIKERHPRFDSMRSQVKKAQSCFSKNLQKNGITKTFSIRNAFALDRAYRQCVHKNAFVQGLNYKINKLFVSNKYYGAPFAISFAGFVGGNRVTLHNRLPRTREAILGLGDQLNLILTNQIELPDSGETKAYKDLSIREFKSLMTTPEAAVSNLFTTEEGFRNTTDLKRLTDFTDSVLGPISGTNLGIYGEMLQAIRDAKQSVFIDIFWMGGTIGMNLAKELFKKVNEDPNFSVFIITDNENKFEYGTQLDMIYRYMRAFSEKFTDRNFYITPTQINLKRTALPEFADLLISKNVIDDLSGNKNIKSRLENDGFHLLAKSDHTKTMVVDGKDPQLGRAFVGSKNWTNSSGGVNEDEVAEVSGPATALILDSFYYDVYEAFKLDLDERLGGDMVANHLHAKFNGMDSEDAITQILEPIDVVSRYAGTRYNLKFISKGDAIVSPAQNNVYGTEMSAIEQNIKTILGAKKQILIDDQFLYDPRIIEALKVARLQHGVEIYVILESLLGYKENADGTLDYEPEKGIAIPNNLFVPELSSLGIQVKAYRRPEHVWKALTDSFLRYDKAHPMMSATFHMKSLSVDGVLKDDFDPNTCGSQPLASGGVPILISGSANKDIMTMNGGFREYQVQVFGDEAVITHDCYFWQRWKNAVETDGLDFDIPAYAAQIGVEDHESFLNFLRQTIFTLFDFKKDLF